MTSEVKQRRARSVLGWGTAWEDLRVLSAFSSAIQNLLPSQDVVFVLREHHGGRSCATKSPNSLHRKIFAAFMFVVIVQLDEYLHLCFIPMNPKWASIFHVVADGHTASNAPDLF